MYDYLIIIVTYQIFCVTQGFRKREKNNSEGYSIRRNYREFDVILQGYEYQRITCDLN